MQKWTRDRTRRRKKQAPAETAAAETEQIAPLQPNYPEPVEQVAEKAEPEEKPAVAEKTAPKTPRKSVRRRKKKKPSPAVTDVGAPEELPETAAVPVGEAQAGLEPEEEPAQTSVEPPVEQRLEVAEEPEPAAEPSPEPAPLPTPSYVPAPAPLQKQHRASKGAVVLAVGLPGSGKSTWFRRRGVTPLSSDMVRQILFDSFTEQRHQDLVFGTLRSLLRARLIARMPMNYVDATNLSPKERRHWIKMAKDFGYEAHAVYFDVPLEVCMDRNQRRNRIVPEDVMHRMGAKLRPPTFDEGFSKIIVVRVKQPQSAESLSTSNEEAGS